MTRKRGTGHAPFCSGGHARDVDCATAYDLAQAKRDQDEAAAQLDAPAANERLRDDELAELVTYTNDRARLHLAGSVVAKLLRALRELQGRRSREPSEGHAWYGVEGAASGQWSGLPIKEVICFNCKRVRPLLDCLNDPLPCVPPPRETREGEFRERLRQINDIVYAKGLTLGSEDYFKVRELAVVRDPPPVTTPASEACPHCASSPLQIERGRCEDCGKMLSDTEYGT